MRFHARLRGGIEDQANRSGGPANRARHLHKSWVVHAHGAEIPPQLLVLVVARPDGSLTWVSILIQMVHPLAPRLCLDVPGPYAEVPEYPRVDVPAPPLGQASHSENGGAVLSARPAPEWQECEVRSLLARGRLRPPSSRRRTGRHGRADVYVSSCSPTWLRYPGSASCIPLRVRRGQSGRGQPRLSGTHGRTLGWARLLSQEGSGAVTVMPIVETATPNLTCICQCLKMSEPLLRALNVAKARCIVLAAVAAPWLCSCWSPTPPGTAIRGEFGFGAFAAQKLIAFRTCGSV